MNYDQLLEKLIEDMPRRIDGMRVYEFVMPNWFYMSLIIGVIIIGLIAFSLWFLPVYSVWSSKKRGEAELAEANFSEQVAISKATARLNSAEMNKKAEIVEAEAVSESIKTIGNALSDNEGYLRWQWIKSLADTSNEIIYVPTETNLPILEASRTNKIATLNNDEV